jgi:hypothetical protein
MEYQRELGPVEKINRKIAQDFSSSWGDSKV